MPAAGCLSVQRLGHRMPAAGYLSVQRQALDGGTGSRGSRMLLQSVPATFPDVGATCCHVGEGAELHGGVLGCARGQA